MIRWSPVAALVVIVAVTAVLATTTPARAEACYQVYLYYSIHTMYGYSKTSLDDLEIRPDGVGYSISGGRWVTVCTGTHTLSLVYTIAEDRVNNEEYFDLPKVEVMIAAKEVSGPPGLHDYPDEGYWRMAFMHPYIWNSQDYTTFEFNGEVWRRYYKEVTFEVTEDGYLRITGGDGWGISEWSLVGGSTTTSTTTVPPTQTTTTTAAEPQTTVIGTVTPATVATAAAVGVPLAALAVAIKLALAG